MRSVPPAVGAALWTTNRVQAAPVTVSKRHLARAQPQAVLINAGVANAATGAQGEADAVASAEALAATLGLATEEIIVLSTGVIGVRLPVDKVLAGSRAAADSLSPEGGDAAAGAILTTDSGPKVAAVTTGGFTVGGMAKGAGMIHPAARDDARRDHDRLPARSRRARGVPPPRRRGELQPDLGRRRLLHERRRRSCSRTARAVPSATTRRSQRRSTRCARISRGRSSPTARGRRSCSRSASPARRREPEAEAIARRIATSPLVKTAAFGHDPNWGRVLAAAGSAPYGDGFARLDTDR